MARVSRCSAPKIRSVVGSNALMTYHPGGSRGSSTFFHDDEWLDVNHHVQGLLIEGDECTGVELAGGEMVRAHAVISAIPWFALGELLPRELLRSHFFAGIPSLRPAPIISINLWFDRPVTELVFAGLRGTTIQWLFNKGKIFGRGENYVSLVVSGARRHVARR